MVGTDRTRIALLAALLAVAAGVVLLASGGLEGHPPPSAASLPNTSAEERAERIAAQEREIAYMRLMRRQYRWGIENLQRNLDFVRYQQDVLQDEVDRLFGRAPVDHPLLASLAIQLSRLPEQREAYRRAEVQVRGLLAALETDLAAKESAFAGDAAAAVAGF